MQLKKFKVRRQHQLAVRSVGTQGVAVSAIGWNAHSDERCTKVTCCLATVTSALTCQPQEILVGCSNGHVYECDIDKNAKYLKLV